jgi:hypothetical protein
MEKYKSKIGIELILFIGLILGFASIVLIIHHALKGLFIIAAVIVFCIYLFKSISYSIDPTHLIINCGFGCKRKIQIDKITKIKETYNPLSSPATSIDIIGIYYSKSGFILISPENKRDFINRLTGLNPGIKVILRKKSR